MQINPQVKMIVGGASVICGALLGGAGQFTTLLGEAGSNKVIAGLSLSSMAFGGLITWFGAASSSQPGPLAPADPPVVQAATKLAELSPMASSAVVNAAKDDVKAAADDH